MLAEAVCVAMILGPSTEVNGGYPTSVIAVTSTPAPNWTLKDCDGFPKSLRNEIMHTTNGSVLPNYSSMLYSPTHARFGYEQKTAAKRRQTTMTGETKTSGEMNATDNAPIIFLLVNKRYDATTFHEPMVAFRTRAQCEAAIQQAKEEVAGPEYPRVAC